MEPSDSSTRPIPLTIDLNSTPSPSSDSSPSSPPPPASNPLPFIRSVCYITPSDGLPASLPNPSSPTCPACSSNLNNEEGRVAVCDSCERGFHLACVSRRGADEDVEDEWRCDECVKDGEISKRWKLGRSGSGSGSVHGGGSSRSKCCSSSSNRGGGGVRLLDINALPVSDGEGSEELLDDSRY